MEKIKLFERLDHADAISRAIQDFIFVANEKVIPLMRGLGIEVTKESVINAACSDNLKDVFIKKEIARNKINEVKNAYLKKLTIKDFEKAFEEKFNENPYDDKQLQPGYEKFILLEQDELREDYDAIREAATVFVEPHQMDAYKRHQTAVKALNNFFKGKAPSNPNDLWRHFVVVDGDVKAGTRINYESYV